MGTQQSSNRRQDSDNKKNIKSSKLINKKNIILFLVGLLFLTVLILLSPLFAISDISITQVTLYSADEIYSSVEEFKGTNGFISLLKNTTLSQFDEMFEKRYTEKEKNMLFEYPLIKDVEITYSMPGKLIVKIEERTPVMMTEKDGMFLHLDSEGYLLGAYTQENKPQMPIVKGIEIKGYKIGASIADGKDKSIDAAIKICSMMNQLSMLSYIDIIDVSDYNNISMHCTPSLTVKFGGTEDAGRKLSYIKGIIDSGYDGNANGVLDVSSGGNPIFKENSNNETPN